MLFHSFHVECGVVGLATHVTRVEVLDPIAGNFPDRAPGHVRRHFQAERPKERRRHVSHVRGDRDSLRGDVRRPEGTEHVVEHAVRVPIVSPLALVVVQLLAVVGDEHDHGVVEGSGREELFPEILEHHFVRPRHLGAVGAGDLVYDVALGVVVVGIPRVRHHLTHLVVVERHVVREFILAVRARRVERGVLVGIDIRRMWRNRMEPRQERGTCSIECDHLGGERRDVRGERSLPRGDVGIDVRLESLARVRSPAEQRVLGQQVRAVPAFLQNFGEERSGIRNDIEPDATPESQDVGSEVRRLTSGDERCHAGRSPGGAAVVVLELDGFLEDSIQVERVARSHPVGTEGIDADDDDVPAREHIGAELDQIAATGLSGFSRFGPGFRIRGDSGILGVTVNGGVDHSVSDVAEGRVGNRRTGRNDEQKQGAPRSLKVAYFR